MGLHPDTSSSFVALYQALDENIKLAKKYLARTKKPHQGIKPSPC